MGFGGFDFGAQTGVEVRRPAGQLVIEAQRRRGHEAQAKEFVEEA